MSPLHINTPLLLSEPMSRIAKGRIYLKMEAMQPSGSFKNRGIGYLCSHYATTEKVKAFISSSGGNAGMAVAYSGKCLNVPVKVIIPKSTPQFMVDKIKLEGAEVIVHGEDWNAADQLAREHAKEEGCFYISPFDHPLIWKGHASMIHEIKEQNVKPDAICLAVGGGGLLCGVIQGLHEAGWGDIPVFTAETEGAASFAQSVKAGHLITLPAITTIATSLGAKKVTEQALEWSKNHPIYPQIVSDKEALEAVLKFEIDHGRLVEPACGAALSLIYSGKVDTERYQNIVVIVCGGTVITKELLEQWKAKLGMS